MNETKDTKTNRKNVVIMLGVICIVLTVSLGSVIVSSTSFECSQNNMIDFLNSQISQLESNVTSLQNQIASDNATINSLTSNITNLQEQLNSLLNGSTSFQDIILGNPSSWVNKTVMVEGNLGLEIFPPFESVPYSFELSSDNYTIGVSLNSSQFKWYIDTYGYSLVHVLIYGTVEKGEIYYMGDDTSTVTYYIEAQAVAPL